MAIEKETITALEKTLRLKEGTLEKAITDPNPVKVDIPELVVRTTDEQTEYEGNLKTNHFKAAQEIQIKEAREKFGLTFTGKTMDNFADALKTKALEEAKIEPNAKVKELETDLKTVRENFQTLESNYKTLEQTTVKEKSQSELNNAALEKITIETVIPKKDVLTIFKTTHEIERDEHGKIVVKKDGQVLKNTTTLAPLTLDEVMGSFVTPYAKTPGGGAGGGDEGGGKGNSMDAFIKEMEGKNIKPNSEEFQKELNARVKAKTIKL